MASEPLLLVEGLVCMGIFGGAGLPPCRMERALDRRFDGAIALGSTRLVHGGLGSSSGVEGIRNLRVLENPSGKPVSITLGASDNLLLKKPGEIIWLRNLFTCPDSYYWYLGDQGRYKVEPQDAVIVADEVVLNDFTYRLSRVPDSLQFEILYLDEAHKTIDGMMACTDCMAAWDNPSRETVAKKISFPIVPNCPTTLSNST
jgi:hypothetical protein